jgi:hypothetical protein
MNHKFDELAKNLAQSVTRRGALKKFGLGLVGVALVSLGLANKTEAAKAGKPSGSKCRNDKECASGICWHNPEAPYPGVCL